MPYILVHPFPPPRSNPYAPDLPTFTTSSRPIAHFFHSHGWRAKHVSISSASPVDNSSAAQSLTSSPSSTGSVSSLSYISASSLFQTTPSPPDEESECCRASRGSSIVSCCSIVELHDYLIPTSSAISRGPFASERQVKYLLYYAWPHIDFEDADEVVDLHMPNLEALALQHVKDKEFWRIERKALRARRRKTKEAKVMWRMQENNVSARAAKKDKKASGFEEMSLEMVGNETIDEEQGRQWKIAERALLASENLEWDEAGKTLRQTEL